MRRQVGGTVELTAALASRAIEGVPVLLARSCEIYASVLRRQNISQEDFDEALRQSSCRSRDEVELDLLETNVQIAVIRRE